MNHSVIFFSRHGKGVQSICDAVRLSISLFSIGNLSSLTIKAPSNLGGENQEVIPPPKWTLSPPPKWPGGAKFIIFCLVQ